MSKNYIDVKCTIWERIHFTNETNMEELAKRIENGEEPYEFSEEDGFTEQETLYDTSTQMTVQENQDNSTIEVYLNNENIWENG